MPGDIPFGFGLPGGDAPDPNDPRQMQQFLNQLQSLFAPSGSGPVNWELARQIAQAHLTGVPVGGTAVSFSSMPLGFTLLTWYLITRRHVSPILLLGIYIVIAMVAALPIFGGAPFSPCESILNPFFQPGPGCPPPPAA